MSTNEPYEILENLRKLDAKIMRLNEGINEIPIEIQKLEADLNEKRSFRDEVRASHEEIKTRLKNIELDLKEREALLEKAESKLMEVKTNIEYQAALKENEEQRVQKSKLEDEAITLLTKVEELQVTLSEKEKVFQSHEKAFQEDKQRLETESNKLKRIFEEELEQRKQNISALNPKTASLYQRIFRTETHPTIALVENGLCKGCRIKLRPQQFNEILGHTEIHTCPNCGRILITPSQEANPDELGNE